MTSIEIIFAESGPSRGNAGDGKLPADRLEPSLSSFRRSFPEAKFTCWTDQPWERSDGVEIRVVAPGDIPFDRKHPRYPWRFNDYFEAHGLLQSTADIAIAIDSDLLIVNSDVRTIIPLVERYGLCMPDNARRLVWRDAASTCDGGPVKDVTRGMGKCRCTAFWAFLTKSTQHRKLLQAYCEQIKVDAVTGAGARGPLSLWRAEWETGITPYGLPGEWCVTGSTIGLEEKDGRTIPVVLHVGHQEVSVAYAKLIKEQA